MTGIIRKVRDSIRNSKPGYAHRFLRYRYRTEPESIRFIQSLDLKGGSVLDVGANRGVYCYFLSRCVGPSGNVTAFEPQPDCRRTIDRVRRMFGLENLDVHDCGLSDRCTTATIHRGRPEHGSASLHFNPGEHKVGLEVETRLVTLDSIADTLPRPIRFVKIDIESHEPAMLRGAVDALTADKPVILVEIVEDQMEEVNGFLSDCGFVGSFHIGRTEHPISEHASQPFEKGRRRRNYIFRPADEVRTTPTS